MAVVTIGGVLLSAVFTLFLIAIIYTKLDRFSFGAGDPVSLPRRRDGRTVRRRSSARGGRGAKPDRFA